VRGNAAPIHDFVKVDGPVIALTHARVIDGTGAAGRANQTIVLRDGHIAAVGDAATVSLPSNARSLDLEGRTVMPGYVMVHEHLFFSPDGDGETSMRVSFPPLYLAGGATTIRTAGSRGLSADVELQRSIDKRETPARTWH
jgi:enamidase